MVRFEPDPGPTPDADLIDVMRRGNVEAFEELYARHRDWVFHLAFRFTGNREDALDVLQETFAYLLKQMPRLQLYAKLTTYIYPVVKNLAMTVHRKKGRTVSDDTVPEQAAPAETPDADQSRQELTAVFAGLPVEHREVLLMRFVDDMRLEEIADALAIPIGTVKSRLHNALAKLRRDPRLRRYFER
ncbi:MAG: sigma-70 family RNA polymerase sigma factor [Planctomycetota bacterium]